MPIFEFTCEDQHLTERLLKSSEDADDVTVLCQTCGKETDRVAISLSHFELRGKWFNKGGY